MFLALILSSIIFASEIPKILKDPRIKQAVDGGARIVGSDEIKITIMGAIIQKEESKNVVLMKIQKTGKVVALRPGDKLSNDYRIKQIFSDAVIVSDKSEKNLVILKNKFDIKMIAGGSKTPTLTGPQDENTFREPGFERVENKVSMSTDYRDRIVKQDLAQVLMQATATPHLENNQITGFKLTQIEKDSIFQKSGLLDNDIITKINGNELKSVAKAISLLKSLKNETDFSIELVRGGNVEVIDLRVK